MPALTESQRVYVRHQMGRKTIKVLAEECGVHPREVRYAHNPELREKELVRARERYGERKFSINVPRIHYRATDCGDGRDARCRRCGRVLKPEDFTTDLIMGVLIETMVCVRCAG